MAESVSDKKIMDSYVGILRVSSEEEGITSSSKFICDSDGHESSLGIASSSTTFVNDVIFGNDTNSVLISGNIKSKNLIGSDFSIGADGSDLSLQVSPKGKNGGIYITNGGDEVIGFTSSGIKVVSDTKLDGSITIDGKKEHKIVTNEGTTAQVNLKNINDGEVLMANAEDDGTITVSFSDFKDLVKEYVDEAMREKGSEKNNMVPVGSVIYITLPSYDFFRINIKALQRIVTSLGGTMAAPTSTYDDKSGSGYSMIGAANEINKYLGGLKEHFSVITEDIKVDSWNTLGVKQEDGTYVVKDVTYIKGIDINKPSENNSTMQRIFNECICSVSGFELRMPSQYLGYWDFCLGQYETSFVDPITSSGGHTPYTKDVFPQLWQVLRPLDDEGTCKTFCLPNLGYEFIRCAGQDPRHGQASKVILQSELNPNESSSSKLKVLPYDVESGDTYNNMVKYDSQNNPIITDHVEPSTIESRCSTVEETTTISYVPKEDVCQSTNYRGLTQKMSECFKPTTTTSDEEGSFFIYSYIGPDTTTADTYYGIFNNPNLQPSGCFTKVAGKETTGYSLAGQTKAYNIFTSKINYNSSKNKTTSDLYEWMEENVFLRESRPRHSVLIPIIKIRDMT